MIIDCHAHLHVKEFDADRDEVIARARKAGVSKIINVGFDREGNFAALALAKKYDFIYATMGIHPHLASEWNDSVGVAMHSAVLSERTARARRPTSAGLVGSRARKAELTKKESKIVALGEMGLDYHKNFQPVEVQKKAFAGQLALVRELGLPVIIHCRDAFADVFQLLKEARVERVLMHCFTGTMEEAREAWRRGYMMAFTGIITYPSASELRKVAALCPADNLLVETDCPFLAPQSRRGKRNEPAYLKEVIEVIALERGVDYDSLSDRVESNACHLFGLSR